MELDCKKRWALENKEKVKDSATNYRERNRDKIKVSSKIYNDNNKDKHKKYYEENKEKIIQYQREYKKNKKKTDSLFKLKNDFSKLLLMSFKRQGFTKRSRTFVILGCSFEEFKLYLDSKFEPWMNWNNKGFYNGELNYGWDIDHVIPQSTAKTEDEFILLNHYTNLQPLCSHINRDIKKNKEVN